MDRAFFEDSGVTTTPDGIRFRRRQFTVRNKPIEVHNASDGFAVILPTRQGRIKLIRHREVLFDGGIRPGTVRLIQPDERAQVTLFTAVEQVMLSIPGALFRRQASEQGLNVVGRACPQLNPVIGSNSAVQRIVPLFDLAAEMSDSRRQTFIAGLSATVLALLLDRNLHRSRDASQALDDAQYEKLARFAESRLSGSIDLTAWADAAGLSPSDFARRFQKHTGVAPYTWFIDRRIAEAKRLMLQGPMPLVEVALAVGFCSQSHFTEAFRRRVGMSPGRWRKALRDG